ncbi:MAG: glycerate kinase [Fimbriimonas sp.]
MLIQASPKNRASELALQIYKQVLGRVRGDFLVHQTVQRVGSELFIQGHRIDLSAFARVLVCGAGKASIAMAHGLSEVLGDHCGGGLIVTKEGHAEPVAGLAVIEAGHPVPTQASLDAGQRMLEFAAQTDEADLVLFLLSGGASSLMEAPIEGIELEDLIQANERLLGSGQDIRAINAIRSQLSRSKGGGLARAFAPATVICLVLSDVVGNDLKTIGSAPFMSSRVEPNLPAGLIEQLPASVRTQLNYPVLKREQPKVEHYVIGSVSLAIHEAAAAAKALGLTPLAYSDPLQGEARQMAKRIMREAARQSAHQNAPFCLIFGGETTVTLKGKGMGGRCQEMAAAASLPLSRLSNACFLAAGTDGTDGPTIAAGGIADSDTCRRAASKGLSIRKTMRENDSFRFLEAADALILTGPTGSNVNDLALFVSS